MHNYIAAIQAGGKGTRMVELTKNQIPKPLLMLNGKPMIQWQIENIAAYGIKHFVIIIGHLGEKIKEYFGDGKKWNVHISYVRECIPLGSAGALFYLKTYYPGKDFLFVFGDVIFDIDWKRMVAFHEKKNAIATLLVHPNSHPYDSDLIVAAEDGKIIGMDSKENKRTYWYDNLVNSGIYIFHHKIYEKFPSEMRKDLEKDVLLPLILQGKSIYGYRTSEYVKDAGTPKRFKQICEELNAGIPEKKNLKSKQKCVFLDRDGTVNSYRGFLYKEEDFELIPGVAEAVRRLNTAAYLVIVITNQPVVARGLCTIEDVKKIHRKMQVELGKEGAYLDDVIFCPHHPDKGYPEENPDYKVQCSCRKPATGMIDKMVEKYNIDIEKSYIIGDTTVDIKTGKNAGIKTILVRTGQAGQDQKFQVEPDNIVNELEQAVDYIIGQA